MTSKTITFFLFSVIFHGVLHANTISINFTNGDADKSLASSDNAGVAASTNWNAHTNAAGSKVSSNLVDSSGSTTTASVTTTFGFANQNSGGSGTANDKLYRAYGLIKDTESINISGLPASITTNGYSVLVYFDLNLGVAARSFAYTIGGSTLAGTEDTSFFTGTFTKSTGTLLASATQGNYVHFTGLTASSFSITGAGSVGRAPICGIQIVPDSSSAPTIASFSASSNTFTVGDSVTLSWNVTGSTSVSLDQSIGAVLASYSTVVTPTATTTYTLTAYNGSTPTTAQVTLTLNRGVIHVYLLGGQSNMQGVGRKSKLSTDQLEISDIMLYHSDDVVSTASANTWATLRPVGFDGSSFGPEIAFGETLHDLTPGQPTAFIKHAFGGSSLEIDWAPGANASDTGNWGAKFAKFVTTVNAGIAALEADGWQPEIQGMIWQQGEQDAKDGINAPESSNSADNYGSNLSLLIDRVREQFSSHASANGIRFVLGQVLPYAPAGGDVETRFPGRSLVRKAQLDLDENSGAILAKANTATVPTNSTDYPTHEQDIDGYRDTDEVHLNYNAQLALGRSMAYKMLKLAPQSYIDWSTENALVGGQTDDDDNDGLSNLEEFYLGSTPTEASNVSESPLSIETIDGIQYLIFIHVRNLNALTATGTAQYSVDLKNWNDGTAPVFVESSIQENGTSLLKYRAPVALDLSSTPQAFMRLLITL